MQWYFFLRKPESEKKIKEIGINILVPTFYQNHKQHVNVENTFLFLFLIRG